MMRPHYAAAAIFLVVCAVHSTSPVSIQGDSRWTVPQALSLIHHRSFNLDDYASRFPSQNFYLIECVSMDHRWTSPVQQTTCPGGHFYYHYPPAVSVVAAPLVAAIQAAVQILHPVAEQFVARRTGVTPALFNNEDLVTGSPVVEILIGSFFVAATTAVLFLALLQFVSLREAAVLAFMFAFCSSAWSTASRALFEHGPSMLLNSVCIFLMCRSSKRIWLIGPLAVLAFFVRPTNLIPLCVFAIYLLFHVPRQAVRAFIAALPVVALFVTASYEIYGAILPPYFTGAHSRHPLLGLHPRLLEALAGNWISPGRGLLVYSPFFVMLFFPAAWCKDLGPVFRRMRPYLIAIVLGSWITVSLHDVWWGGFGYGPRYMCDLLPFLLVLMVPVIRSIFEHRPGIGFHRAILAATLAIAFFIHARGAYSIAVHNWNSTPVNVNIAPQRIWDWSDPPFLRGLLK